MTEPTTPAVTVTSDFEAAYEGLARGEGHRLYSYGVAPAVLYVLAMTPGKAKELLIAHLGITLTQMTLTDANLKFLDAQRLKSTPPTEQPS